MLLYIGKIVLLFTVSIAVIRLMGKAAMAQLTPHDLIAIIFLATLAVTPMASEDIGKTIVGILAVMILHVIWSRLALFRRLRHLLIGHPTLLVKHGKLIKPNLKSSLYSLTELLATLRSRGYPDVRDVEYAILEPTGDISIIPRNEIRPVTPRHLNLHIGYSGLPLAVIMEGTIIHRNLELVGKDESWLKEKLQKAGHPPAEHIFYASVRDTDHSLLVDTGEGENRMT